MAHARRIDIHHHLSLPPYSEHLRQSGYESTRPNQQPWTQSAAHDVMKATQTDVAILSLSRPGVHLGDQTRARSVARQCNESAMELIASDRDSFGYFAILTLPDVSGSVAEARYALDELGADGVILLTNAHGTYLGDPSLDPLMHELNEREAVVFVHPTHLPGGPSLQLPSSTVPGVPAHLVDFLLDTTRAAVNMAKHHVPSRFPRVRIVLAHAGGFLPFAADRVAQLGVTSALRAHGPPAAVLDELRLFYFDVALSSSSWALPSLWSFTGPERILYGSDFPAVSETVVRHFVKQLDDIVGDDPGRRRVNRTNAEALFTRFHSTPEDPGSSRVSPALRPGQ